MLETVYVDENFEMLMTDSLQRNRHQYEEKSHQHNDSATNILNLPPTKTVYKITLFDELLCC